MKTRTLLASGRRRTSSSQEIDSIVGYPYQAAVFAGTVLPVYDSLSSKTLVDDLVALSTALLNQATRLDLDEALYALALDRVMTKRRPSHDGHIKDSIDFERFFLAVARQLRTAGFVGDVLFVSKNRKDYWDGDKDRIHPDLKPEIEDPAIQLRFFRITCLRTPEGRRLRSIRRRSRRSRSPWIVPAHSGGSSCVGLWHVLAAGNDLALSLWK